MAMRWWLTGAYIGSAALHLALLGGLQEMPRREPSIRENIAVFMASKPKAPKAKAKPPPPDEPIKAPKDVLKTPRANPRPAPKAEAPPPEAPKAEGPRSAANFHPGMADFGISMSGTSAGGGIAVGPGGGGFGTGNGGDAPKPKTVVKEKTFAPSGGTTEGPAACDEPMVKAKPSGFVQPQYTDDARSAGVEGRVRLRIQIDASGNVSGVSVLSGLGHGLDQAAMSAARRMHFSPATQCGKPVASSFVIAMRFVLGE